jgi:hypothetical protein
MKKLILNFLREEDGWLNFALMGASALASYLSGRKKKQEEAQTEDLTTTTTPNLSPEILSARQKVLDTYTNRLGNNEGYLTGYTGQGLRKINRAGDLQQEALQNTLAARGLSSSPVSAALSAKADSDRFAQSIDFQNTIPLLNRQLTTEDLTGLSGIVASAPYGSTSVRKGATSRVTTGGSNAEGAEQGISSGMSIAALLNKYYPQGW